MKMCSIYFKSILYFGLIFLDGRILGNVIMLGYYESEFDWKNETNMVSHLLNFTDSCENVFVAYNCFN